jgi:GTP-binding protein EngB required for normal cell division
MINDIDDHKDKFQYIFTKFDPSKRQEVPAILLDIIKKINKDNPDDLDEVYLNLLRNLQSQAKFKKVIFLDPL